MLAQQQQQPKSECHGTLSSHRLHNIQYFCPAFVLLSFYSEICFAKIFRFNLIRTMNEEWLFLYIRYTAKTEIKKNTDWNSWLKWDFIALAVYSRLWLERVQKLYFIQTLNFFTQLILSKVDCVNVTCLWKLSLKMKIGFEFLCSAKVIIPADYIFRVVTFQLIISSYILTNSEIVIVLNALIIFEYDCTAHLLSMRPQRNSKLVHLGWSRTGRTNLKWQPTAVST